MKLKTCLRCSSFLHTDMEQEAAALPRGTHGPTSLQWRHNGYDGVSNHQPHDCLLNRLFKRISKNISKFRVTGLCVWNSPMTGEFPAQMASNAENVSIWWRHHVLGIVKAVGADDLSTQGITSSCGIDLFTYNSEYCDFSTRGIQISTPRPHYKKKNK